MSIETSKTLLTIIIVIWFFTLLRSITIMIGGKQIFKKASKNEKSAMYPILNLFSMLEIAEVSTYYGILFFVPVANLVVLSVMSYKLGSAFKTSTGYKILLVLLPIIFYPALGKSDKQYKLKDDNYFIAFDTIRNENINLMTDEEIKEEVNNNTSPGVEEEKIDVDSVFKNKQQLEEKASPYKAAKIDLLGMQKLQSDNNQMNVEDLLKSENEKNNNQSVDS